MAEMWSYNGLIAPNCPQWQHGGDGPGGLTEYGPNDVGAHIVFRKDGEIYMIHTGMNGGYQFNVEKGMFWTQYGGGAYKLVHGEWEKTDSFPTKTHITEAENIIWSSDAVRTWTIAQPPYSPTGTYKTWEPAVLVSEGAVTLEALPTGILEVNSYGATGIIVGARIRYADGTTTDVSTEANYSFDAFQAPHASLDASRQLIINEGYPFSDVEVHISYDNLPGQTATLIVMVNIESGGGGGGEDPEDPDIPIDPDLPDNPELTAEERKAAYWRGFASGAAMYGVAVLIPGEVAAASESSGASNELKTLYWRGFASAAAMYGAGKSGAAAPDKPAEPVAFLYNGKKLPPIGEYDEKAYPHLCMYFGDTYGALFAFSEPHHLTTKKNDDDQGCVGVEVGETYLYTSWFGSLNTLPDKFVLTKKTAETQSLFTADPDWANYDVLNEDGTVYLPASDPVPVYE